MKRLFLFLIVCLFLPGKAFAIDYCQWDGSTPQDCVSEQTSRGGVKYIVLPNLLRVSGGDANYNSHEYYKVVTMPNPPLQEGNMYTDWSYAFVVNEIQRTRNQDINPNLPTPRQLKEQKFSEFESVYDSVVDNCMVGTKLIPDDTRRTMLEALARNVTLTYKVIETQGVTAGFPIWLEANPTQIQGYLDNCIAQEEEARQKMGIDSDLTPPEDGGFRQLIIDCPNETVEECLGGLIWATGSTQ